VKRIILASVLATTCGCAARSGAPTTTPEAVAQEDAAREAEEAEALRVEREAQQREIRRLEAQLALARAEQEHARQLQARTETVRIGGGISGSPHDDLFEDDPEWGGPGEEVPDEAPPEPEPRGPRPVLRLYGSPAVPIEDLGPPIRATGAGAPAPPVVVPVAPPGISMRLPVTDGTDGAVSPEFASDSATTSVLPPMTPPAAVDPVVLEYRRALALIRDRRLGDALVALQAFESAHSDHPYAHNALYWQAEVLYMQRRYREAMRRFEAVIARRPSGSKVPDALLKIGLCYERMGDRERARAYFRRVRTEFPNSVAARTVSREDAS